MISVLVVRSGALGDFLITLPHLFALQEKFGRLVLATRERYAQLARRIGLGDEYWMLESATTTRKLFQEDGLFEGGVVMWTVGDGPSIRGSEFTHLFPPVNGATGSVCDYYFRALESLGIAPRVLPPLRGHFSGIGSPVVPRIVLHPGSGTACKRWSLERYIELAEGLSGRPGAGDVKILVGPEDDEWARDPALAPFQDRLAQMNDLVETAEYLADASLYVGNDSGITHLSASLGVPTVGIYGPTSPSVWGARGERVAHVYSEDSCLETVSVETVLKTARALIDDRPGD